MKLTLEEAIENPFLMEWVPMSKPKEPGTEEEDNTPVGKTIYLVLTDTEYSSHEDDWFFGVHMVTESVTIAVDEYKSTVREFFLGDVNYDSTIEIVQVDDLTVSQLNKLQSFVDKDPSDPELKSFMIDFYAKLTPDSVIRQIESARWFDDLYEKACKILGIDMDDEDILDLEERFQGPDRPVLEKVVDAFVKTL